MLLITYWLTRLYFFFYCLQWFCLGWCEFWGDCGGFLGVLPWQCTENCHIYRGIIHWHARQCPVWRCSIPMWKHPLFNWTALYGRKRGMIHTQICVRVVFLIDKNLIYLFLNFGWSTFDIYMLLTQLRSDLLLYTYRCLLFWYCWFLGA
jgi:hypothetical protein